MPKQGSKSGKSGKSSKTARVLNLLTDPESVETSADAEAPSSAAESAKLADDRRTQAKIRGALEGALEMELAESAPPARPKRPKSPKSSIPGKNIQDFELKQMHEGEGEEGAPDAPQASGDAESAAAEPSAPGELFPISEIASTPLENTLNELRTAGEQRPDEYICFNVMQALVEDKADKYIKMFGLCNCNRCRIDVIALALSNLPAKYVVAKPHDLIPRLSIYEQKFSASVVTQVMSACRKVLDRPHHQREQGS